MAFSEKHFQVHMVLTVIIYLILTIFASKIKKKQYHSRFRSRSIDALKKRVSCLIFFVLGVRLLRRLSMAFFMAFLKKKNVHCAVNGSIMVY